MQPFIVSLVVAVVAFTAGTVWGRKLEQKALGKVLGEFYRVDAEARSAVNRLYSRLPFLKKHI